MNDFKKWLNVSWFFILSEMTLFQMCLIITLLLGDIPYVTWTPPISAFYLIYGRFYPWLVYGFWSCFASSTLGQFDWNTLSMPTDSVEAPWNWMLQMFHS